MSIIPKSMLPLEELYAFKETVAKYWKKLLKPALIQSLFGDMVFAMLLVTILRHFLKVRYISFILGGCFFIFMGILVAHIVFRCLKGESIYDEYDRDD